MSKKKDRKARKTMERAAARLTAPERADVKAAAWAAQYRKHPVVKAASFVAEGADQPQLVALSLAVFALGVATGDARLRLCGMRMVAAIATATALKTLGKRLVARTRPNAVIKRGGYRKMALGPVEGDWNAFPSGHTAGALAVARAVGRTYPDLEAASLALATFAGVTQIFKGGHFPSDVLAGAVVGVASELGSERAVRAIDGLVAEVL
jgi:membrane-associated phospholipid phosphatase